MPLRTITVVDEYRDDVDGTVYVFHYAAFMLDEGRALVIDIEDDGAFSR